MLYTVETYLLLFFIYSIGGWLMEVIGKLIEKRKFVNRGFLIGPYGIIEYLGLKEPIYTRTTNYGHFGKENLPWEKIIKI